MFSQTEMESTPQTVLCRKAGTLTELRSLKHSPSVNANITFFFKGKKQISFHFQLTFLKNPFYKILKAL